MYTTFLKLPNSLPNVKIPVARLILQSMQSWKAIILISEVEYSLCLKKVATFWSFFFLNKVVTNTFERQGFKSFSYYIFFSFNFSFL